MLSVRRRAISSRLHCTSALDRCSRASWVTAVSGIGEPHEAPDIIGSLEIVDGAAPAIETQRLSDGQPISERHAFDQEQAQPPADALDNGEGFRRRELPHRVGSARMKAPRHGLDRLAAEADDGIPVLKLVGIDGARQGLHVCPRLLLERRPAGLLPRYRQTRRRPGSLLPASEAPRRKKPPLQEIGGRDRDQHAHCPIDEVAMLPQPDAAERNQCQRRNDEAESNNREACRALCRTLTGACFTHCCASWRVSAVRRSRAMRKALRSAS